MTLPFARRRSVLGLGVATALGLGLSVAVLAPPAARADQTYYVPVSKSLVLRGHGYGHGHGMSQYGAEGAALQGLTYAQIVMFYYPGTRWAQAHGRIRVLITADWSSDLQVRPTRGLIVRDLRDRATWSLPRARGLDRWRLIPVADGSTALEFHNSKGWHRWRNPDGRKTFKNDAEFHAAGPLTLLTPGGNGVRYRGLLRLVRPSPGATTRDTVNVLSMDAYVKGVVPYEMPASWRPQALEAQSVAARTYAAWQRSQDPTRYYQICDTTSCQVYGGVAAEQGSSNAAVRATAGKILTAGGSPAFTQFSSSSGGWTSYGGVAYLPAKKDPYDRFAGNPVHSWTVTVSASVLENAYPGIGRLIDLRVTKRDGHGAWHGRAEKVVLDGTTGKARLTGDDVRGLYGLRSTWFKVSPTPIVKRWQRLGGPRSELGAPRSGEYPIRGGAEQMFQRGRIFWSHGTGAREVKGAILTRYRGWGGPHSDLGWPRSGMMSAHRGGHRVSFQRGVIYSGRSTGAHVVYGAILSRWSKRGGASSWLGYPTTNVSPVRGGLRAGFQRGVIRWDRSTDAITVRHR